VFDGGGGGGDYKKKSIGLQKRVFFSERAFFSS
jgi:hypothetical protein